MKYRNLPGTGISVSNLALGTMGFGTEIDEGEAFAILDRFVEADGNLVDTANVYGGGVSEEVLGRWFASRPADVTERVVLATKARFGTGPDVNEAGIARRNLDRALSASLRRLGRENVDLYQLHGWDPLTPIEETLGFLDDAVHAGKIHYVGLSNFTGWQLQLTLSTAAAMGPPACRSRCSSSTASSAVRTSTRSSPPRCTTTSGCCPGPRWPAASSPASTSRTRSRRAVPGWAQATRSTTGRFDCSPASSRTGTPSTPSATSPGAMGATPSQVALSWVTNRPSVTAPIIAASNLAQLEENLAGADLELDEAATHRLDGISAPTPERLPLRALRREAARPLRRLQRAGHPRAHIGARQGSDPGA